jgi:hypothetical protein
LFIAQIHANIPPVISDGDRKLGESYSARVFPARVVALSRFKHERGIQELAAEIKRESTPNQRGLS